MIFAIAADERSLYAFATEAEAIAYCEGIDVSDGNWLFWDDAGLPLAPSFTVPNQRGSFVSVSGSYKLQPASATNRLSLIEALRDVVHFDSGIAPFDSAAGVRKYLVSRRGA